MIQQKRKPSLIRACAVERRSRTTCFGASCWAICREAHKAKKSQTQDKAKHSLLLCISKSLSCRDKRWDKCMCYKAINLFVPRRDLHPPWRMKEPNPQEKLNECLTPKFCRSCPLPSLHSELLIFSPLFYIFNFTWFHCPHNIWFACEGDRLTWQHRSPNVNESFRCRLDMFWLLTHFDMFPLFRCHRAFGLSRRISSSAAECAPFLRVVCSKVMTFNLQSKHTQHTQTFNQFNPSIFSIGNRFGSFWPGMSIGVVDSRHLITGESLEVVPLFIDTRLGQNEEDNT